MNEVIEYSLEFESPVDLVYDAFLNSEKHTKFTGAPAKIEPILGGSYSTFGGNITGSITSLEKNKLIELNWRPTAWPDGIISRVKIKLSQSGNKTKMEFKHYGVPQDAIPMIKEGWETNYWQKLPNFLQ